MERKSILLEVKDLDTSKRTAIIKHAAYNNIDRTKDISRKGMFAKSWGETKAENISLYFNHDGKQAPGKVLDVYEDNDFAYTKAWFGTHTLGNDVLTMLDEGIIKQASFGYKATQWKMMEVKGERIRELKEVIHPETSVLTVLQANPRAGIASVTKAFQGMTEDEIKSLAKHLDAIEKFCRNTNASDDCIIELLAQAQQTKQYILDSNTAFTHKQPDASAWKGWFPN